MINNNIINISSTLQENNGGGDGNLVLKLKGPEKKGLIKKGEKSKKQKKPHMKVSWTEDVIDNEHMNKRKSNSKTTASIIPHTHIYIPLSNISMLYLPCIRRKEGKRRDLRFPLHMQ